MKLAKYVADFVADLRNHPERTRVYGICGAGAMHLNDAFCHHEGILMVPMQHEQAATFAAEAEARITNSVAVVHVTAGPGGSNTLTGLACAYVDSIPLMVIAGQVTSSSMINYRGIRQGGMNELDMVAMATPVTKYAVCVKNPLMIRYHLEKALTVAMTGRRGPVFIEIPLDVQAAEIDADRLEPCQRYELLSANKGSYIAKMAKQTVERLSEAKRPVVIIGNGVRLAGACNELLRVIAELQAPVISSWSAADIVPTGHPYYIGRCGIFGDRTSNYAVQHADVLLAIGTRLSVAQIGHHAHLFAPKSYKIVVDVDAAEAGKLADLAIVADALEFLKAFHPKRANRWTAVYYKDQYATGASYAFVNDLSWRLADDAIIITDVGFCFIPTMQTMRLRQGQRLIHSCGVSPMGWALPAAIGAAMSTERRQIVCLTGDGGLMLNVQELYTIAQRKLPIAIVVYANNGYATMRIAQNNHFQRESVSGPSSGLPMSADMLLRLARSFGIHTVDIRSFGAAHGYLASALESGMRGPVFAVLRLPEDEIIAPRVQARMENGKFVPVTLEDQWPYVVEREGQSLLEAAS